MSNKTRKWRSAIAMVLVICMLFSIFPVAAFADSALGANGSAEAEPKEYIKYVSLGDSMTNGYGLEGYEYEYHGNDKATECAEQSIFGIGANAPSVCGEENHSVLHWANGYLQESPEAYPAQFAQWLVDSGYAETVELKQMAMSGMRAEDLHFTLEFDYSDDEALSVANMQSFNASDWEAKFGGLGDKYTWENFTDGRFEQVLAYDSHKQADAVKIITKEYQDEISSADVISVSLGNSDFGVFLVGQLLESVLGQGSDASWIKLENALQEVDPEVKALVLELKDELDGLLHEELTTVDPELSAMVDPLVDAICYTVVSYVINYAGSLEAILTLNPDAEIILVGIMNTLAGMDMTFEGVSEQIPMSDVFGLVVEPVNAYVAALPAIMQKAGNELYANATIYYAEAPKVECMVSTYQEAIDANNATVRDRFITELTEGSRGICVWRMLNDGMNLGLVYNFDADDVEKYIARNEEWLAEASQAEMLTCAIYLAFENAIVAASEDAIVPANSFAALLNIGTVFDNIAGELSDFSTENIAQLVIQEVTAKGNADISAWSGDNHQTVGNLKNTYNLNDSEAAALGYALANGMSESDIPGVSNWLAGHFTEKYGAICTADVFAENITPALKNALTNDDTLMGLLHLYGRMLIGNGLGAHPSAQGHDDLTNAITNAYENKHTVQDETIDNLLAALEAAKDIIVEYYDEAYAYAYDYAEQNGYIEDATGAIDSVIEALNAIDLSGIEMTDEFRAELQEQINDIVDVLKEAQELIEEADVLDQDTLDALMELLGEAGEMMTQLGTTLEQAGVDVIVPALEEAYEVLMNEVVPAIIADLEEAIAEGTAWLMEKAQEAIDALVEALPEMAQFAHDYVYNYLLNDPAEVIAFFNEYGDEIIDAVSEYGPYALAAVAYIADTYGDEILAFVMENDEEILEVTAMLLKEHGPHAVQLIQVYAEELGYCQAVRDLIADLEDQIADLKAQLEDELKAQLEDLKAELEDLYEQLENASDDVKEQIQNAIEEVEKLIDEVEQKIAEIEAAIAELEAQLEAAQKALEEAIDAVEAVVEAIKDAIEAGVETVEEILAVIDEIVKVAEDTIAGVKTAIEGIQNAVEDIVEFVDELIANGIVAAEMIEEIIDTVMDIIDGVKAGLEQGDIDAAIEAIRNELTNGYEELSAMLAAIDTAIAEQLDAIVGDLEAALAQAQDEFEEALYNATHGEIACDAKIFAVGGNTATAAGGYADILVADERWNLTEAENIDGADVILYQADPQKFSKALKAGLVNAFAAVLEKELNPSMADFVLGQLELEKTDAPNWNAYITDENAMAYFEQAKADLVNEVAAEYGEDVAELMSPVIDTVMYAVVGYAIENIATIESLSEANEDALIVAVGMYNPVQGMTVTIGGEEIDIEALCQYLIEVTDVYNLLYAIAAQNAVFVDVSEAETNAVGNVDVDKIIALDGDEFDNVLNVLAALDSNYANADGHAYIAAQILDAIDVVHDGGCPECEVKDIPVTGVTLNTTEATMTTGSSLQLVATVLPENATNKAVTWESDDEDLITVDENGLVTSYSTTGSAYIIVTTEDGNYTAECEVTVEEKPIDYVAVTGVTLDEEAITLIAAGETQTLTATVEPSDATDKSVIWTSSNPEVATVVNGVVTAVANGEAIITVTTANGSYTDTCSVTVNIPTGAVTVPVTGVALDKDTLSLKVGNTAALTATVAPDNATNKAVTWASSDESVATVANGVVTAVAKGTATITVTTVDGSFTDTCAVTVTTSGGGSFGGGGGYIKPAKPEVLVPDNAVADGVTVTVDHIDYLTVNEVKDLVAKDDNLEVIGGRDSGALVAVKPANAVTSFAHPVQLTVPVSKSALQNVDDVNKLTLTLVTTDAQGNIQLTYVGGNYDASKGTFTAYVNQPGKYVLMEKLDIVKLELTIDRYVVFVNGEPIINDVPSRIVNNRTIVPAARVLHHLGCTVEWIHDIRTVAVTLPDGSVLNMPVDEPIPGFGAAPMIENGRTLVPVAYIADMMDAHVQWVGNDRKVIIVK